VELPAGLCVLGDAVASMNPVHGQGMTVGVKSALLLRDCLRARLGGRKYSEAAAAPSKSAVFEGFGKVGDNKLKTSHHICCPGLEFAEGAHHGMHSGRGFRCSLGRVRQDSTQQSP
jgi:hypothetical protein